MIGHEIISMNIDAGVPERQLQFVKITLIIRHIREYRSTIIPTQDDMLWLAGDDKSWQARHDDLLFVERKHYTALLPYNQSGLTLLISCGI